LNAEQERTLIFFKTSISNISLQTTSLAALRRSGVLVIGTRSHENSENTTAPPTLQLNAIPMEWLEVKNQ
jgi:hypothetical protein